MCSTGSSVGRGALIVFEGCDRTGKSTQCKELVTKLLSKGIPAKEMHFPGNYYEIIFVVPCHD